MDKRKAEYEKYVGEISALQKKIKGLSRRITTLLNKANAIKNEWNNEFISTIPSDISKITPKQWEWILSHGEGAGEAQYRFSTKLASDYGWHAFGYHPETNQFTLCLYFDENTDDFDKIKEFYGYFSKHLKPVKATDRGITEKGKPFNISGLAEDTTSVAYIREDDSISLHIDRWSDPKKFKDFNELVDWLKRRKQ